MKLGSGTNQSLPAGGAAVGMRRVDWIRITVGDGSTFAEAVGVSHRRPAIRPLPLPLAARLTADGVPFVVRHRGPDGPGSTSGPIGNGAA